MIKKTFTASLPTSEYTLYTVPNSKKTEWVLLYATNTSGSTSSFDASYYNKQADTTVPLFVDKSVSSKDFFQVGGNVNEFIMMKSGDKILVSGSNADAIKLLVSVIEYNDIIQGG